MSSNRYKATPELEDFAGKYENNSRIAQKLLDNYFESVRKLLDIIDTDVPLALEVGCGEGYSTAILRESLDKKTTLKASEYVKHLVKSAQERNPGIEIIEENVYEMKRKDKSIDLIFLLEVLEHLDYPDKALHELARVSSQYLILGVPREPIWRILNMSRLKYLSHFGNTPGHLNHWTGKGIQDFVEKHFGEVIAVEHPLPWTILLAKVRNTK